MRIQQVVLKDIPADFAKLAILQDIRPQLILVFGCVAHLANPALHEELARRFPEAQRVGCSTAGEISAGGVESHTSVVTAVHFERVSLQVATTELASMAASSGAGEALAQQLAGFAPDAVMVFGQGLNINGSALIEGMVKQLGAGLPITGGLAGDDGAFRQTYTLCNDGVSSARLVALGLKGAGLLFAHGSFGGWKSFGPARRVTRCDGNVLYELDGEPALDIYKRYLGIHAQDLPGSGLLFPFEMFSDVRESTGLIRTILGVNEAEGSLILAGAINPDGYLRLMHAQTDSLVEGAQEAARAALKLMGGHTGAGLAVLVSCVGRKLVMGGRVEEEIEAVHRVLGAGTVLSGFYSYGEISPGYGASDCQLHNQTMTITYLAERDA